MKSIRTTLALIALATAGFAQAQEATPVPQQKAMSSLDRATVVAETHRAMAAGEIAFGEASERSWPAAMHAHAGAKVARLSPVDNSSLYRF